MKKSDSEELWENTIEKHCEDCGNILPPYPYYTEHYEYKQCPKCGKLHRKPRLRIKI